MKVYTITGMAANKECGMFRTEELGSATKLYTSLSEAREAIEEIASSYRGRLSEEGSVAPVVGVNFGLFAEAGYNSELGRLTVHYSECNEYVLEKIWVLEKHELED